MKAICRGIKFDVENPQQREQWHAMLLYMALTVSRHPDTIAEWRRQIWEQISTHPRLLTNWRDMNVEETMFSGLFAAVIPSLKEPLEHLQWEGLRISRSENLFAISDRCVAIAWAGRFGTPNDKTLVVMPLSKNVVLIGGKDMEVVRPLFTSIDVSTINAVIYQRASECVFSTERLDYEQLEEVGRIVQYGTTHWTQQHAPPDQPKIGIP